MSPELRPQFQKIERVSGILQLLFLVLMMGTLALPFLCIWFMWVTPTSTGESFFKFGGEMQDLVVSDDDIRAGKLNAADKIGISVFSVAYLASFSVMFAFAIALMQQFKRRAVFSAASVRCAKGAAYAYLASVLIFAAGAWTAAVLTGDFQLNGHITRSLLFLGLCWLFVWVMQIGKSLQVDSEMTI